MEQDFPQIASGRMLSSSAIDESLISQNRLMMLNCDHGAKSEGVRQMRFVAAFTFAVVAMVLVQGSRIPSF